MPHRFSHTKKRGNCQLLITYKANTLDMKYVSFLLLISLQANAAGRSVDNLDVFNVLVSIFTLIWLPTFLISTKKYGNKENWANNAFSGLIGTYGLLMAIPFSIQVLFNSSWGFITTVLCIGLVLYDNLKTK